MFDASPAGTIVGNAADDPSVGEPGGYLEALPHSGASVLAVDIDTYANGSEIIVGDGAWTGQNGVYTQFDTSGLEAPPNGAVPGSFDGVAIDPVTDTAIFAGDYFDGATFQNTVGFWNEDGTYLFSFGTEYVDSEVLEGHLVFAVNAADDGIVISADDGSTMTVEELTGNKARFFDDGLFAGSFGFIAEDASGNKFATTYTTNPIGGGEDPSVSLSGPESSVVAESLTLELSYSAGSGDSGVDGAAIDALIGDLRLSPVNTTLDSPSAATAASGILYVGGSHIGQAAYQSVDLTTGAVGQVNLLDSLDVDANGAGNPSGNIEEIKVASEEVTFVGYSDNGITNIASTSWTVTSGPSAASSSPLNSGRIFDVSTQSGVIVGDDFNQPSIGSLASPFVALPNESGSAVAVDIDTYANGSEIIVGDEVWIGQSETYSQFDTSGFQVPPNGSVPTSFDGVAVDRITNTAIIAGDYFDLSTFSNTVGFWREDGMYLGSFGTEYVDSEYLESDHLIFAVNSADDGIVISADDFSSRTLEQITGSKARFFDDGLFEGSFGFGAVDAGGNVFVSTYATNDADGNPGDEVLDSYTVNWGDGTSETFDGAESLSVTHAFTTAGTFVVEVIGNLSDGSTTEPVTIDVTAETHALRNIDGVSTLVVGADENGSRISVYDVGSDTRLTIDGEQDSFRGVEAVRVIGQEGNDRVYARGNFHVSAHLGDGNDRFTGWTIAGADVSTGKGRDRISVRSNGDVTVDAGAGRDFIYANGNGRKTLLGGDGNDHLFAYRGENLLLGGDGRDFLYGRGERDILIGGNDRDRIFAFGRASLAVTGDADLDDSLIDDLFGELSQSSPNAATLNSLLDGRTTDGNARDFLFGRRNVWGLVDDEDRVWGRINRL